LAKEPHRHNYNEGNRAWLEETLEFYNSMKWDFTLPNNETTIDELLQALLGTLSDGVNVFDEYYEAAKQRLLDTDAPESSSSSLSAPLLLSPRPSPSAKTLMVPTSPATAAVVAAVVAATSPRKLPNGKMSPSPRGLGSGSPSCKSANLSRKRTLASIQADASVSGGGGASSSPSSPASKAPLSNENDDENTSIVHPNKKKQRILFH
jgi:hypothetical protein